MATKTNTVKCSFCSSEDVNKIASFGTAQLFSQYYCNHCKTVLNTFGGEKTRKISEVFSTYAN